MGTAGGELVIDPCLVVSIHLDDAALSAGQFLAGRADCVLLTVCAGQPDPPQVTAYDTACGFRDSDAAMTARRGEDNHAAKIFGATTAHLMSHLDGQYGTPLDVAAVADDIGKVLAGTGATMLLGPLGLAHADHEAVASAVLDVAAETEVPVWLYEELPARVLWPETVLPALGRVRERGWEPTLAFPGTGDLGLKIKAIRCYRSQLAALHRATGTNHPYLVPERFWLLSR